MPDIKEHGLIFQAESIRAILAGLKTMTRRVVTAHNSLIDGTGEGIRDHWQHLQWDRAWVDPGPSPAGNPGPYWKVPCHCYGSAEHLKVVHRVYPRVQVGDNIYAKETWHQSPDGIEYRADDGTETEYMAGDRPVWRSPLHMPRWASRIVLPVIGVKAERVQDISEGDIIAEGCPPEYLLGRNWFRPLWQSINGKKPGCAWDSNPCTWVYEWEPMG